MSDETTRPDWRDQLADQIREAKEEAARPNGEHTHRLRTISPGEPSPSLDVIKATMNGVNADEFEGAAPGTLYLITYTLDQTNDTLERQWMYRPNWPWNDYVSPEPQKIYREVDFGMSGEQEAEG